MKTPDPIIKAAQNMDWQQVVLNGGPPCFHLQSNNRFCGRAQRWDGHEDIHKFKPLAELLTDARQDLAEQVTKLEGQLKEAESLLKRVWNKVLTEYHSKESPIRQDVEAFLASLDQREGKGRKI